MSKTKLLNNIEEYGDFILKESEDGTKITVRDVHEVLIEMMIDIDKICRDNNIEYLLIDGSALGAIRHKGFIPWDDDMDLAMSRENYNKLIKALDKDLDKEKYTYHCYEKNKKYNVVAGPAMKIRKKGTYIKEVNTLLPNRCKDSDGIFIDVSIIDHVSKHKILDLPLRCINTFILMPLCVLFDNLHINPIPLKALFRFNGKLYGKLCKNSKYVGVEITWVYISPLHPACNLESDIFPPKYVDFEKTKLPVPNNYDAYLTRSYGKHYMDILPKNKQHPKHIKDINLNSDKK